MDNLQEFMGWFNTQPQLWKLHITAEYISNYEKINMFKHKGFESFGSVEITLIVGKANELDLCFLFDCENNKPTIRIF